MTPRPMGEAEASGTRSSDDPTQPIELRNQGYVVKNSCPRPCNHDPVTSGRKSISRVTEPLSESSLDLVTLDGSAHLPTHRHAQTGIDPHARALRSCLQNHEARPRVPLALGRNPPELP